MRVLPFVIAGLLPACSDAGAQGPVYVKQACAPSDSAVDYPGCPYSEVAELGGVVPNKRFVGRMAGINSPRENIDFARFHAMRAEGKKYLVYSVAAFWCSPCKEEAREFQSTVAPKYGPRGVAFLGVVLQDERQQLANDDDVDLWIRSFKLTYPVVRDEESWSSKIFVTSQMPFNMIINLETMKVELRVTGADLPRVTRTLDTLLGGS